MAAELVMKFWNYYWPAYT